MQAMIRSEYYLPIELKTSRNRENSDFVGVRSEGEEKVEGIGTPRHLRPARSDYCATRGVTSA